MAMNLQQKIMKALYPVVKNISQLSGKLSEQMKGNTTAPISIWDAKFKDISGKETSMSIYKGKKILIVNTASGCGFTGQFKELQMLQDSHQDDLVVIGFPSNDFKEQEKLSNEEIVSFCEKNYGVKFLLAEKSIVLKKENQNPIFIWLTDQERNGWNNEAPSWNFTKYLIDENGDLKGVYEAGVNPGDLKI
jgi:glutathione peroxidase